MAAMAPKKSGLLIALGGLKKPSSDSEPDMGDPGESMESDEPSGEAMKGQAADDVFEALKSDNRELFADAFDRYVKACM